MRSRSGRGWGRLTRPLAVVAAGGAAAGGLSPVRPGDADEPPNQVLEWDRHAYDELIGVAGQPPPTSALHLAMVHGAMYDAVSSITGGHQPYLGDLTADPTLSTEAAAATAAHRVLSHLLPARTAALDPLLQQSLVQVPDGPAETGGIAVGVAAADAMIAARTGDGRPNPTPSLPNWTEGLGPGEWRPVPPTGNAFAWLGRVTPFVIEDADHFATRGPLKLQTGRYANELEQVKQLGSATSTVRTPEQTLQALFWADHTTALWARMIRQIAERQHLTTEDSARYFASVYMTGSDALIACFDDKERHGFWRPETAIEQAAADGNRRTSPDASWTPLITNPPYPDHPSGANCLTSGFLHAMRSFFGTDRMSFDATTGSIANNATPSAPHPPIMRSFTSFSQALEEMRWARVYSGLHFMTADDAGVDLGRAIARWIDRNAFQPA